MTSLPPPSHGPLGDGEETPGEGLKTIHVHDTITSGAIMTSLPVGKNASHLQEITSMTSLPVCDVTSGAGVPVYYYSSAT